MKHGNLLQFFITKLICDFQLAQRTGKANTFCRIENRIISISINYTLLAKTTLFKSIGIFAGFKAVNVAYNDNYNAKSFK